MILAFWVKVQQEALTLRKRRVYTPKNIGSLRVLLVKWWINFQKIFIFYFMFINIHFYWVKFKKYLNFPVFKLIKASLNHLIYFKSALEFKASYLKIDRKKLIIKKIKDTWKKMKNLNDTYSIQTSSVLYFSARFWFKLKQHE